MRLTKFLLLLLSLALVLSFISCAQMTGPEKDVIVKITARRIAFHGFKTNPDLFTSLGKIAKESCQGLSDQAQPADIAFKVIIEAITTKSKDRLLAQDIQDIVALIGIKFDAAFTLLGLTPDKLKFITLFVCSFSQGIEAAQQTTN
ncbi:unnamed protein product [marine sediment metagenome]|uniref:Lipoprotein n=1 Tax=marine sediment metagenome TaxID=412755 RepID=X1HRY7_9ZZZZ